MIRRICLAAGLAALVAAPASAAYLINIDTDGADDGVLTFHPNFGFGGDTTTASQSSPTTAVGTNGADSIFGGDGANSPDTYTATYTPSVDGDSIDLGGTALNDDGDIGSPLAAGGSGVYDVYATWPTTNNVSGGLTTYRLSDGGGDLFSVAIDQNTVQGYVDPTNNQTFAGGEWVYLGSAILDAGTTYTLYQESGSNTFVSMRSAGYLFDYFAVPEPTALGLLGAVGLVAAVRRR